MSHALAGYRGLMMHVLISCVHLRT